MDSSTFSPIIGGWFWVLLLGVLTSVLAESTPEIGDMDGIGASAFSCEGKVIGGYYADVDSGCQMFHVCTLGQEGEIRDIKFLCLAGTIFDQETRVCERSDEVDCSASEQYYHLNLDLFGRHGLILPTLTGRKVPPSGEGNTLVLSDPAALSEEERMLLLMEEHQHQNSNSGMLDPDYEDEDYEDELAVIIQQEFETGTTSIPTTITSSTATSTTSTTTTTTTSTTPLPITTERIIPVFHAFDSGSPDVVHFQYLDVAASHQFNTTSPTPITPPSTTSKPPPPPPPPTPAMELQPHHYVVRQEFSVTSITSFHPVTKSNSNDSTTTIRPPTTTAHRSAAQIQEDEDVYELLGQIEADVPRIRSRPQHMSSNVFVPRFKRQAEPVKTRVRAKTNPTSSATTGSSSSQRVRVRTTTTTEIPLPLEEELTEAPATRSPTSRRNRVRSTTTTTTTTESPPIEEPEAGAVPDGSHFDCTGRIMGGFYADVQNGCRQFHICGLGKKNRVVTHSFFCGAGLLFDQASLTCQDADKVNCKLSPSLYHLNDRTVLPDPEEFDTFQFKRVRPSAGGR